MKTVQWKLLTVTCLICLLPICLGIALWNNLPDSIAIHFNIQGEPDNFAPKAFAVFGLPLIMALLQTFCCIVTDLKAKGNADEQKFTVVTKWIIPILSIFLQSLMFLYALEWKIDIRRCLILLVSALFLVLGFCVSKLTYTKNRKMSIENSRKVNRFIGIETVIMGILGLITILLPPAATMIWVILLIPYTVIAVIYGIKVERTG